MRIDDQSLLPATSVHSLEAKRAARTRDLATQADEINRALKDLSLAERLKYVRREIDGKIVLTTGFGMESQVILHHIAEHDINIEIATLDTGRLFPETYKLWEDTERRYNRRIRAIFPRPDAVADLVDEHGINGFYKSKDARLSCCHVRKVEPLKRALTGAKAWVAGLRGSQSVYRAGIGLATANAEHKLIKVNPLFDWSREDVVEFVAAQRRADQSAARSGLRLDRLRALHARDPARRRRACRPLVVGKGQPEGMRPALGRRRSATGRRLAAGRRSRLRLLRSIFAEAVSNQNQSRPRDTLCRDERRQRCNRPSDRDFARPCRIHDCDGRSLRRESRRNRILDKLRQRLHRHVNGAWSRRHRRCCASRYRPAAGRCGHGRSRTAHGAHCRGRSAARRAGLPRPAPL